MICRLRALLEKPPVRRLVALVAAGQAVQQLTRAGVLFGEAASAEELEELRSELYELRASIEEDKRIARASEASAEGVQSEPGTA